MRKFTIRFAIQILASRISSLYGEIIFAQENCEIRRYRYFFLKPAHTKSGFTIVTFGHILFLLCRHTNFQPTNCTMTFKYVRMMVGLASPLLDLTPAMAATEMAPIGSPGLIIRAKAGVPHSGTDREGRC
jgi:hypothetical protein